VNRRRIEGSWLLLPERSRYQHGEPPRRGTYAIAPAAGGLAFTLEWEDSKGAHRAEFRLHYDRDQPGSLEWVDDFTLNTTVERGDLIVEHASRQLSEDGQSLHIVQRGFTSDGRAFVNEAFYSRLA
jgi:hypothetical protein